jgi:hypothetical protein
MQLTIECKDAGQIATIAHLAEMVSLSHKNGVADMKTLYPHDVICAVRDLMEAFDDVLSHIDSPYICSEEDGKLANSLAYRLQGIGERILEMKNELPKKPASENN